MQRADRARVVGLLYADDQVQAPRALIDGADADAGGLHRADEPCVHVCAVGAVCAHHRDHGQMIGHGERVGVELPGDVPDDVVLFGRQQIAADDNGDRVDAGQALFKGHPVALEYVQKHRGKARAVADHALFHLEDA